MDLGLAGKNALVLASSRGLGQGIAKKLIEEGVNVLLCGRTEAALQKNVEEYTATGPGTASYTIIDLSQSGSAEDLYQAALDKLGRVDILINNGGGPPPGKITAPDSSVWTAQFDTMVVRFIELANLCLPSMKDKAWGRVLTLSSAGVLQPIPSLGISNTLRSALIGWSKTLSNEIAEFGITSNLLVPGRIHTARIDELDQATAIRTGKTPAEVSAASRQDVPIKRYGTVEEFAAVAAFLVSEPASYITGSVIRCDGGATKGV